ncbi:MAG: DUF2059 domain-containing protein [Rhizobiaceae bacterium]
MSLRAPQISFVIVLIITALFSSSSFAQEPSASHLAVARKALSATKATESFDAILFNASAKLKNQLIAKNPDKADAISNIVDEEALALATRRGDLEGEATRLFATQFTEQELNDIAAFFSSEAGSKYLATTPVLATELSKSARVWANGITRDMSANVLKRMSEAGN